MGTSEGAWRQPSWLLGRVLPDVLSVCEGDLVPRGTESCFTLDVAGHT